MLTQTIPTTEATEVTPARALSAMTAAATPTPYHQALATYRQAKALSDEAATVFARLPADCSDQDELDAADSAAAEAKMAAWLALAETPAPTLQDAIDKAILMQSEMEPHERPLVLGDRYNEPEAVRRALLEIQSFAEGAKPSVRPSSFLAADGDAWATAISTLRAAKMEYDILLAANYAAIAAHRRATVPAELQEPLTHYGVACRWYNPEHLEKDVLLSGDEKARLLPILMAYWDAQKTAAPPVGDSDADNEALTAAYDRWWAAEKVVLELDAPDVSAAAERISSVGHATEYETIDLYDPAAVLAEAQTWQGLTALKNSIDILRFGGHAVPAIDDFDCGIWIKNYEEAGGKVATVDNHLLLLHAADDREAQALRAVLVNNAVRTAAMLSYAETRRTTGGDPIFWSGSEVRKGVLPLPPTDRVKPYRADGAWHVEVVTFADGSAVNASPLQIAAE